MLYMAKATSRLQHLVNIYYVKSIWVVILLWKDVTQGIEWVIVENTESSRRNLARLFLYFIVKIELEIVMSTFFFSSDFDDTGLVQGSDEQQYEVEVFVHENSLFLRVLLSKSGSKDLSLQFTDEQAQRFYAGVQGALQHLSLIK
jgi:hypothetical protein